MARDEPDNVWVRGQQRLDDTITLVAYDPRWPEQYERRAATIGQALGCRFLRLEHIGSTSVPGLSAKPIIDILLVIDDPADESTYVPALERAGYRLEVREEDWYQHRLLKPADVGTGEPDTNLHVHPSWSPEIERNLAFRDWLRTRDDDRELYERTKRELAGRRWRYVQDYADAKGAVVEEILTRALGS